MSRLLIGLLVLALAGTAGLVAAVGSFGGVEPARSVSVPAATDDGIATTGLPTATEAGTTADDGGTTTQGDVSGPCDEAEHALDPRCTGAAGSDRDDDSGSHGRGDDGDDGGSGHGDDDHDDD